MASIYGILDYDPGKNDYVKDDIVKCGPCLNDNSSSATGRFYYNLGNAVSNNTNGTRPSNSGGEAFWGGYIYIAQIEDERPFFQWLPDYNVQMSNAPRVHVIKFGDGYEQRIPDGINNNLMNVPLTFNNRNEKETVALSHFLATRAATEPFYFRVPEPHNTTKKFICKQWSSTMVFENNFSTTATFEEVS